MTCKATVPFEIEGYEPTKKGAIRVFGKCSKGHKVTTFASKANFEKATKMGSACPYAAATGGNESDFEESSSTVEAAAGARRSRGSRNGSRKSHSRKGSRKSHSRKGSRKSHSRKGSRKSHSRKGSRKSHSRGKK